MVSLLLFASTKRTLWDLAADLAVEQTLHREAVPLTRLERAMDFICRHGCEPYLHYSQKLLYQEREASLRTACIEYLAEQEP